MGLAVWRPYYQSVNNWELYPCAVTCTRATVSWAVVLDGGLARDQLRMATNVWSRMSAEASAPRDSDVAAAKERVAVLMKDCGVALDDYAHLEFYTAVKAVNNACPCSVM